MPIVNDNPTTIYVRDLDDKTQQGLQYVKKKFHLTSNGDACKKSLQRIEEQDNEIADLKTKLAAANMELNKNKNTFTQIKSAFNLLTNL